ncbi:hypothetical protein INT47_000166 [Mucor saturninus]|uniref:Uncharacterized protein n=1 Tax=Mucor saturninus TaxID=64648 RepID=A0A8H7RJY3_9FUNG|nr:hypothetical protein INT47_000166 [Mucor saturninus]
MEEYYDYTKSTHCISFEMMNNVLWCNCIDSDVQNNEQGYSEYEQDYPNTLQNEVIMQEVIRVLQDSLEQKKRYFKIPSWEFHYVFTLPTIWDVKIRDEIRSLFFKAGLVQDHDHPDRLLLINELESRVRYIQSTDLGFPGTQLDNGRQYTMYALDFDEEVLIQMEIFSVHYPATSIDSKRIPRLLEMSQFTIPYQIEKRVYIEACLEERYNIMLSPELLNLLTNESDVPWDAKEKQRYHDPRVTKFHVDAMHIPFQRYFAYKPFRGLRDLYKGEYNLDTSEIKTSQVISASAEKRSFDFYNSPSYFINVDITLTTVDFLILYEEEGNVDIIGTEIEQWLDMSVKGNWIQKNVAYAISVDKWLLDNMFGTKEDLTELLFASGILQRNNNRRKAQIITRGEEILPAIEQKLTDFNFKMKSYFVVSQLHQTYIQLTLHQVVIVSEDETSSTTIIVEDKIIQIEDVYDTLCKTTWGSMIYPTSYIDYCTAHEDSIHVLRNLESLFSYDRYCQEVKLAVPELVHFNKTMYLKFEHNICFNEEECDCSIIIDPQNIVDIGMKSVIQDIATTMAGSLTNTKLFGNYEVDFLFVLGNVSNIPHNSMAYIVYSNMLQESVSDSIDLKEKYTEGLVIREPLCELIHFTTNRKPYIYDRFIAVFKKDIKKHICYLVVLQTGQEIPISGLKLNLEITILSGTNCENLSLDIIRVEYSGESVNGFKVLEEATQGASSSIYIGGGLTSSARVIVEFEYVNYNYSLKVSAKRMGGKIDSSTSYEKHFMMEHPLTLAYV